MKDIGLRVKGIRLSRGLSLRQFAKKAGVNFTTLKRFEDGRNINSAGLLRILHEAEISLQQCEHNWQTRCSVCGEVKP